MNENVELLGLFVIELLILRDVAGGIAQTHQTEVANLGPRVATGNGLEVSTKHSLAVGSHREVVTGIVPAFAIDAALAVVTCDGLIATQTIVVDSHHLQTLLDGLGNGVILLTTTSGGEHIATGLQGNGLEDAGNDVLAFSLVVAFALDAFAGSKFLKGPFAKLTGDVLGFSQAFGKCMRTCNVLHHLGQLFVIAFVDELLSLGNEFGICIGILAELRSAEGSSLRLTIHIGDLHERGTYLLTHGEHDLRGSTGPNGSLAINGPNARSGSLDTTKAIVGVGIGCAGELNLRDGSTGSREGKR